MLRITQLLDPEISLYLVPGNHDVGGFPNRANLEAYRKDFGRDWYTFRHGGLLGIVLNSEIIKTRAPIQDEVRKQSNWLRFVLAAAAEQETRHSFVFMHHPPAPQCPGTPQSIQPRSPHSEGLHRSVSGARSGRHFFAGHFHRNAYLRIGELEIIVTASLGNPVGSKPGLRHVKVYAQHFEHKYLEIDTGASTLNSRIATP